MSEEWDLVNNKFSKEIKLELNKLNSKFDFFKNDFKLLNNESIKQINNEYINQKKIIDKLVLISEDQNSKIDYLTNIVMDQNNLINNLLNRNKPKVLCNKNKDLFNNPYVPKFKKKEEPFKFTPNNNF